MMKRAGLFVFVWLCLLCGGMYGENSGLLRQAGSFAVEGEAEELAVMHDLRGGMYVLYIADGMFHVVHGTAEGEFTPYRIKHLDEDITDARSITLTPSGVTQYAAIAAGGGGAGRIYVCALDHTGTLVRLALPDIPELSADMDFRLLSFPSGSAALCLFSGNTLTYITGINGESVQNIQGRPSLCELSLPGEYTDSFGLIEEVFSDTLYGWYMVRHDKGLTDVVVFGIPESGLPVRETFPGYGSGVQVICGTDMEGSPLFTVADTGRTDVIREFSGMFIREISVETDFAVKAYYSGLHLDSSAGLLFGETGTYRIVYERSGAPVLQKIPELSGCEVTHALYGSEKTVMVLYERDQWWYSCSIDLDDGSVREDRLGARNGGSALFHSESFPDIQVFILEDGTETLLSRYVFTGSGWEAAGGTPLAAERGIRFSPVRIGELLSVFDLGERLLVRGYPNGTEILAYKKQSRSRMINGILLLAVYDENAVTVYRMGE